MKDPSAHPRGAVALAELQAAAGDVPGWLRSPRRQKLLLGDWNPIVRDPIDVLRYALLLGSALLLLLDKNLEAAPLATVLIVVAPRLLDLPRPLDLAVVLGMSLQAWGNLFDFFDRFVWYDEVVHLLLPLLTCGASYVALAQFEIVPRPSNALRRSDLGVFLVTFLIGMGYAGLYEIYEAGADAFFGSQLQDSLSDTNSDLLMGALGSAIGAALLAFWYQKGYGVIRRLPPTAVVALLGDARARAHVRDYAQEAGPRT